MNNALRPMTTGELLDRTFSIYRNNFLLFVGISALAAIILVAATVGLLALGFTIPTPGAKIDPQVFFRQLAVYFIVVGLFYLIGASFAMGATIYAVSKVYLGQPVNISESYGRVFPRLGRIVGIVLLILLRMIGLFLLFYVGAIVVVFFAAMATMGSRSTAGFAIGMGIVIVTMLTGYVFMIRLYFKYSLAVPACVLENTGALQSLKRSAFLAKGSLWRIFMIYLLMAILVTCFNLVMHLPANLFIRTAPLVAIVWQFVATFFAFSFGYPISTIATCLIYYDQRIRKEAFDLQVMMEALGQSGPDQAISAAPIG